MGIASESSSSLSRMPSHRDDEKRFIVRADELLTAFLELQRVIHEFAVSLIS